MVDGLALGVMSLHLSAVLWPQGWQKVCATHAALGLTCMWWGIARPILSSWDWWIVVWCGIVGLSSFRTGYPVLRAILPRPRWGTGSLTSWAWAGAAVVVEHSMLPWLLPAMLWIAGGVVILALAQFFKIPLADHPIFRRASYGARVEATLQNPILLGAFLCLTMPLVLILPSLWWWVSILFAGALGATGSRWMIFSNPLGAVAVGLMCCTRPSRDLLSRHLGSLAERVYTGGYTLARILRRPLLGYGLNSFACAAPGMRVYDTVHGDSLQIAYDTGVLGLACFCGIVFLAVRHARHLPIQIALVSYWIACQGVWQQIGAANWFWLLLGVAMT